MKLSHSPYRGFFIVLLPATLGGAIWSSLGLPLAWLMGAAIVTGVMSYLGLKVTLPKIIYYPALAVVGAIVGLTITPIVALEMMKWLPLMAIIGFTGVILAAILTPVVAKKGEINKSTAFFSLMPGGIVEMATIGERHGADRTTIAALHTIRVGIIVGILPLGLFFLYPVSDFVHEIPELVWNDLLMVVAIAIAGGWIGQRLKLPAAWLLGAIIAVAFATASGLFDGQIPFLPMAIAQIIVGISLGSKFERSKIKKLPKPMAVGGIALLAIILFIAVLSVVVSQFLPMDAPTMVLALSIGGMAEMVLTARELQFDMAIIAAFQSIRAILINSTAGLIWNRYSNYLNSRS